ncbi:MAG: glycine cleavage system protein GcvH [Actinomycetota bacterium]
MSVPHDRRYSTDHHWIRSERDVGVPNRCRVGLTDFAQDALGTITLVRFASAGPELSAGEEMGEVEAFKAMSDLYMPVPAVLVEANPTLSEDPEVVNRDPYGDGWLCTVDLVDDGDLEALLDADAYRALIGDT